VAPIVNEMLGHSLITNQTPKSGVKVRQVVKLICFLSSDDENVAFLLEMLSLTEWCFILCTEFVYAGAFGLMSYILYKNCLMNLLI